ncbi:MAG: CFI-box-CTERM domain-containing protein [Candidatus Electronema sp. V4]|uniref:CFI-box-CTERM domain-containing protein n=1 Tax=Candidatus Electronema sp. V4 TaxID=3454756 RepID=UPI0040554060
MATALYGEDSSKVQMLCFFRDEYLSASSLGRAFIAFYVRFSPPLAWAIAKESLLRTLVRYCIVAPALLLKEKFFAHAGRKDKLKWH